MRSRLQLNVCNICLWRRHLVNAYEVKAAIGVIVLCLWAMATVAMAHAAWFKINYDDDDEIN